MKKFWSLLLVFILVLTTFTGCQTKTVETKPADVQPININLGHAMSEGTPASDLIAKFCDNVAQQTNGRVVMQDFPNSQLGSETEMLEQMKIGSLDAAAIMCGTMQSVDIHMAIEDLPYMWKDIEHARAAFDGKFGDYLGDIMKKQGMEKIAYVEWGFRHITNNKRPIVKPEDLKGLKIRVAQTKLRVDTFEQVGALPTIMSFSELYGALQQGVVDAQENPLANIAAANFNEVQKYLSLTGHFYNTVMLVIDTDIWGKIAPDDQKLILAEGEKLSADVRVANDASQADYLKKLADKGMIVNDNVDKAAFREAMLPVYDKWEKNSFGKELMDIYREASGY